ncbi:hypothetical protein [Sphingomonas sp. CARO-RG-8B-R24-01]|uniref:hypothetical protein n=1 Tax=Sphingomonas sp. CARO-RG-8B-R24-01 TaxID=2914831 RepID=UPI001F5A52C4
MHLTFTKGTGKYDHLHIERSGLPLEMIQCPKQGIIPHDMIHYAVESVVPHRGFLSLLREGQPASFLTQGDAVADAIERLVETFQAEMWSGRVSASDAIAMYEHGCAASGHAVAPVSKQEIEAIRVRIDALSAAWSNVPEKGTLIVGFDGPFPRSA